MTSGSQQTGGARRTVQVVIGCDTDPDRESLVGVLPHDRLSWRGVTEGIPALKAAVANLRDARGRPPVFTWLIRADEQVRTLCGEYAWTLDAHGSLLRSLAASGDELGWHPHFWRRDEDSKTRDWYQEVEDTAWQLQMLREAHAALTRALPPTKNSPLASVRMGWNYHTGDTMRTLDALGIKVDFSALPGMRTFHGTPPRRSENLFDWHSTPRHPYFPSLVDHRRAATAGEGSTRLLELPIFVAASRSWAMISGVQLARKARKVTPITDALRRPTYWINLTAKPRLFAPLLKALAAELRQKTPGAQSVVFATYFHPDELVPNRTALYDLPSLCENLAALSAMCDREGAALEFRQAAELAHSLIAGPSSAVE